jgi:anaphase-promoting complex subunit 4
VARLLTASREDVFSSRASLDSIFRPFDPKDNDIIDIMVVGTKDSRVHLSIYDSFVIGTFPSPSFTYQGDLYTGQLYLHASHRNYSTHSLIMKSSSTIKPMLYLVPMDLRFVSSSSGYLSLLASKSTALQNLLRYIQQVQNLMISEWKSSRDLPSRFLGNVNETLAEDSNRPDIVQAMYHSVATGHTIPVVKEWLVDELAERVIS